MKSMCFLARGIAFVLYVAFFSGAQAQEAAVPAASSDASMGPDLFTSNASKNTVAAQASAASVPVTANPAPAALPAVVVETPKAQPVVVESKPAPAAIRSVATPAPQAAAAPAKPVHVHHVAPAPRVPAATTPATVVQAKDSDDEKTVLQETDPVISASHKARLEQLDTTLSKNVVKSQSEVLSPLPKVAKLDPLVEVSQELDKINKSADDIAKSIEPAAPASSDSATSKPAALPVEKMSAASVADKKTNDGAEEIKQLTKRFDELKVAHERVKSELSLLAARVEKLEKNSEKTAGEGTEGLFSFERFTHAFSRMGSVMKDLFVVPFRKFFVSHEQQVPVVVKQPVA